MRPLRPTGQGSAEGEQEAARQWISYVDFLQ
jgi:hypothetical protein